MNQRKDLSDSASQKSENHSQCGWKCVYSQVGSVQGDMVGHLGLLISVFSEKAKISYYPEKEGKQEVMGSWNGVLRTRNSCRVG